MPETSSAPCRSVAERLLSLAEAASPGPWSVGTECDGVYAGRGTVVRRFDGNRVVSVGQTRLHERNGEDNVRFIAACREDAPVLATEVLRLTERLDAEEIAHEHTIEQRDDAQKAADRLAYAIAPQSWIGEHTSEVNPWDRAYEVAGEWADEGLTLAETCKRLTQTSAPDLSALLNTVINCYANLLANVTVGWDKARDLPEQQALYFRCAGAVQESIPEDAYGPDAPCVDLS